MFICCGCSCPKVFANEDILYPNTTVDIYIYIYVYMYSVGVGLLFSLGLLLCKPKPKPLHDNQVRCKMKVALRFLRATFIFWENNTFEK